MPQNDEKLQISLTESPISVNTETDTWSQAADIYPSLRARYVRREAPQITITSNLHPYTRPLTIGDLESCVALENAAFTDPRDRSTREKIEYRLSKCGELCLGIFCTVLPSSGIEAETFATGKPVETSRRDGAISVLLGHIIAAKTDDLTATDESMGVPEDWKSEHPKPTTIGHQEAGRTIVLHSVAVLPNFQRRGIGSILILAYMQQMNGAGIADRLALVSHSHKTGWYGKVGFSNRGAAKATFGTGGWTDMVFDLKNLEARTTYG